MHTSEYDYLFKLLLIGDSGVGKVSGGSARTTSTGSLRRATEWHTDFVLSTLLVLLAPPFRR